MIGTVTGQKIFYLMHLNLLQSKDLVHFKFGPFVRKRINLVKLFGVNFILIQNYDLKFQLQEWSRLKFKLEFQEEKLSKAKFTSKKFFEIGCKKIIYRLFGSLLGT